MKLIIVHTRFATSVQLTLRILVSYFFDRFLSRTSSRLISTSTLFHKWHWNWKSRLSRQFIFPRQSIRFSRRNLTGILFTANVSHLRTTALMNSIILISRAVSISKTDITLPKDHTNSAEMSLEKVLPDLSRVAPLSISRKLSSCHSFLQTTSNIHTIARRQQNIIVVYDFHGVDWRARYIRWHYMSSWHRHSCDSFSTPSLLFPFEVVITSYEYIFKYGTCRFFIASEIVMKIVSLKKYHHFILFYTRDTPKRLYQCVGLIWKIFRKIYERKCRAQINRRSQESIVRRLTLYDIGCQHEDVILGSDEEFAVSVVAEDADKRRVTVDLRIFLKGSSVCSGVVLRGIQWV